MDIVSLRRKNLRTAIDAVVNSGRFHSDAAFCEYYDLNPSHISQLVKGHGSFGERAARNLEKKIGWKIGFLDKEIQNSDLQKKACTEEKNTNNNVIPVNAPVIQVPVLDYVQAGSFRDIIYDGAMPLSTTYVVYEGKHPESIFVLKIDGLSMSPDFMPGDMVVVDTLKTPSPGNFVVARNGDNQATFKKYRAIGYDDFGREVFELVPLNPDFASIRSDKQQIEIIGVIIQQIKSF